MPSDSEPETSRLSSDASGSKQDRVADQSAGTPPAPAVSLNVLLAEDSRVNQLVVQHQLKKLGHRVRTVEDGEEALRASQAEQFDLVLMDCQMPHMDGYEAVAEIRRREAAAGGRRIPIIAMTAHSIPDEREKCVSAGMDGLLGKPFNPADMEAHLAAALRAKVAAEADAANG